MNPKSFRAGSLLLQVELVAMLHTSELWGQLSCAQRTSLLGGSFQTFETLELLVPPQRQQLWR